MTVVFQTPKKLLFSLVTHYADPEHPSCRMIARHICRWLQAPLKGAIEKDTSGYFVSTRPICMLDCSRRRHLESEQKSRNE
jgi:hypothetical protein